MTGVGMGDELPVDAGSAVDVADPDPTCDLAVVGTADFAPHPATSAVDSSAPMILSARVVFIDR
jgi:hypothetical protein